MNNSIGNVKAIPALTPGFDAAAAYWGGSAFPNHRLRA